MTTLQLQRQHELSAPKNLLENKPDVKCSAENVCLVQYEDIKNIHNDYQLILFSVHINQSLEAPDRTVFSAL